MAEPKCPMRHKRQGIVTTHPTRRPTLGEGHYAANCCGQESCIRELAGLAYQITGVLGVYSPDPQPKWPTA